MHLKGFKNRHLGIQALRQKFFLLYTSIEYSFHFVNFKILGNYFFLTLLIKVRNEANLHPNKLPAIAEIKVGCQQSQATVNEKLKKTVTLR